MKYIKLRILYPNINEINSSKYNATSCILEYNSKAVKIILEKIKKSIQSVKSNIYKEKFCVV